MLRDLQQKSSHPSIAPVYGSNGGFDSDLSLNSSSNSCFPHSSSSAASSINPWGTWEDLLLASAVLRHGTDNWTTVSCELQARAFLVPPSLFSAEACKVRFWILNGRFSSCSSGTIRDGKIPWFEEVRKLRVAQLKRELERYDGSIGLLQKKLSRLKAENSGSEAVERRDALEPSSLAPHEAVSCFEVCSAGDQMPAEHSLGTGSLLDSNLRKSSHATATTGGGEVKETILLSDAKESLIVENADQNFSSGGLVVVDKSLENDNHNMHLGSILDQSLTNPGHDVHSGSNLDQKPLVDLHLHRVNGPSAIEVDQKPLYSQDCPCSIVEDKRSSVKNDDEEHESKVQDGVMPLDMENNLFVSEALVINDQDDHSSVFVKENEIFDSGIKELQDGGAALEDTGCLCHPPGLDRLVVNDFACKVEELEGGVKYSHGPSEITRSADDAGCAKSESANVLPSSAKKLFDNVLKEDFLVGDSLVSASAMDLLRIAYADGTPVSTPEETEIQPAELEITEELDHSEISGGFGPLLIQEIATCQPDLLCGNLVQVPGEGLSRELQSLKQNQTLGIQMTLDKGPKGLEKATPRQLELFKPASASELEHSSEQIGCQVSGMGEVSPTLSKISICANLGAETVVEKADTGQPQNAGGYSLFSDRNPSFIIEPDNNSLNDEKGDVLSAKIPRKGSTLHEAQDLRKRAWSTSSDCLEIFREDCSDNIKVGSCLETDDVKSGKSSEVVLAEVVVEKVNSEIMSKDVNFPAKIESVSHSPSKPGSHMLILGEPPAVSLNDKQKGSQLCTSGIQSVVEMMKESSSSAIYCENGTLKLTQAVSLGCDPNVVRGIINISHQNLNNLSFHTDGRNSVMKPLFELTNKQQAPNPDCGLPDSSGKGTLKAKCHPAEGIFSERKPDFTTSSKQARFEGRSKQLACRKSSRAVGSSSPLFTGKHKPDADALEEDGLLVDLMKLKETDLTTLRKRKQLKRGGNNVENREDCSRSRDGLGEFSVKKHPKLSRCQEEDGNKTLPPATQNKCPGKSKNSKSNSGGSSGQAAISSTVSSLDFHRDFRSKESTVEVFSTRRSRLKLRKNESQRKEPDKNRRRNVGTAALKAADEEGSDLEVSGVLPLVNNVETSADSNGLLPDLLILLECLRSISGHRFAPLFKIRPEIQSDARYRCLVKRHMDFDTVRTKLEEGTYSESLEFFRDMMLIFSNALVFYSRDSQEYGAALVLRESLMREMDVFPREESLQRSIVATQAVKYSSESKVLQNMNIGCSVTNCKSSCNPTMCEIGLHGDNGASEAVSRTRVQDFGSGNSTCVKELNCKNKDQGDLASSKALIKTRMARTKADGVEADRLNLDPERIGRKKHSRNLEDAVPTVSTSTVSSQVLRKSHQSSLRNSREYTSRKDSSERSRSSKYSFERPCSLSQERQEPRESLVGGGRLSRSAQPSKQVHSRGIQSYCQPQKRART